jgi:hypothetical protein
VQAAAVGAVLAYDKQDREHASMDTKTTTLRTTYVTAPEAVGEGSLLGKGWRQQPLRAMGSVVMPSEVDLRGCGVDSNRSAARDSLCLSTDHN